MRCRNRCTLLALEATAIAAAFVGPPLGAVSFGRETPPGIAHVRSLAELRRCALALREGDWELRFGLADGGEAARDWRLLHCLASYVGREAKPGSPEPIEKMFGSATHLGPVSYMSHSVSDHPRQMVVHVGKRMANMMHIGQYGQRGEFVEELYCGPVPLIGKEAIRVQVYSRDLKRIAETVVPLKEEPAHSWQRFLAPQVDDGKGPPPPAVILARPFAAVPSYSSFAPVWAAKRGDEERLTPKGECLPGQLPPAGGYESRYLVDRPDSNSALLPPAEAEEAKRMPIGLSLADGQFVLESRCVWLHEPADGLLARWWVNDRPVAAPLAQDGPPEPRDKLLRALDLARRAPLRIPAALPQALGPVKPGDKIALQVMYCPAGFKVLGDRARRQERVKCGADCFFPAFQPLLSNRLEFPATKAMTESR
ncbi:MAG: hypothetical protein FJ290_15915 [Planctomycetes bacterium]|nr:hypothetical protein [Planctomycetota bacterium]